MHHPISREVTLGPSRPQLAEPEALLAYAEQIADTARPSCAQRENCQLGVKSSARTVKLSETEVLKIDVITADCEIGCNDAGLLTTVVCSEVRMAALGYVAVRTPESGVADE